MATENEDVLTETEEVKTETKTEDTKKSESQEKGKDAPFDVKKFTENNDLEWGIEPKSEEETEEVKKEEKKEEKKEVKTEDKKQEEKKEENKSEEGERDVYKELEDFLNPEKEKGTEQKKEEKKPEGATDYWKDDAKEMGIEAKDRADYLRQIKDRLTAGQATNAEPVVRINEALSLPDEELYTKVIKAEMEYNDEEAKEHVAEYKKIHGDEGVKFEVKKIRRSLELAKANVIKEEADKIRTESARKTEFYQNLEANVDKMDKVYGMNIASMPHLKDDLKKSIRDGEYRKYLDNPETFLRMIAWEKNHRALLGNIIDRAKKTAAAKQEEESYKENVEDKILNKDVKTTKTGGSPVIQKKGEFNVEKFTAALQA